MNRMTSVLRSYRSVAPQNMSKSDLSFLSEYTVTNGDSQLFFASNISGIMITLPSASTAHWKNYPIIYITNMSSNSTHMMRFTLAAGVKVQAPDHSNYTSYFAIRGGFSGYIIYTGYDQWMLQGVGANFDGA